MAVNGVQLAGVQVQLRPDASTGTVTSVAASVPPPLLLSGSPITSAGTLAVTWSLAQGDLLYGSAANTVSLLNKDTNATRYLSNTGTTNNPAWAQVALGTGVSGILSPANGGTGVANNASSTLTISGNFGTTFTVGATTSLTLPSSGTLLSSDSAGVATTVVTTSQFDKTNDVTLANIPGLSVNVSAATTYVFEATLFTTSNVGTGVQAAIAGTCTATSIIYEGTTYSAGVSIATAGTRTTTKGAAVGGVTAVTVARIDITGTIVVANAGTLTVQFAENAGIALTTSSVLVNSKFTVIKVG